MLHKRGMQIDGLFCKLNVEHLKCFVFRIVFTESICFEKIKTFPKRKHLMVFSRFVSIFLGKLMPLEKTIAGKKKCFKASLVSAQMRGKKCLF